MLKYVFYLFLLERKKNYKSTGFEVGFVGWLLVVEDTNRYKGEFN